MKKKIVTIAFDDGPHEKQDLFHSRSISDNKSTSLAKTPLIGVVCRGIQLLHVHETQIDVDGFNSTEKILEMINSNPFRAEIRLIMIDSPTLGGFNPPNPFKIYEQTNIPVLLIPDRKPKAPIASVYWEIFPERLIQSKILQQLPLLSELAVNINADPKITGKVYFHAIGIKAGECSELLHHLTHFSQIPEPLRLAHLVASRKTQ